MSAEKYSYPRGVSCADGPPTNDSRKNEPTKSDVVRTCLLVEGSMRDGRHLERFKLVMDRLPREGLKLTPAKCKLLQLKTKFIGHVVNGRRTEPDPEKVRAVVDWPTPRNMTETRHFVALASCYLRFVGSFAEIASPVHLLTQKNQPFIWEDPQQEHSNI